ncbi:uncharacterized protein Tco025E_00384 [Trypanosoma conorhini]|uniref:Uncharacterized protein n=1 Tax=Trypanosoma conorhini TaxID=83891 RepID=A0A422QBT5_9TRYP|nr:uncharacterized protein Tco025E_00384 [Trypanosoma conorhini]RNF27385.1 hypothetical protein Tco025E_00384 [Trypanosoma conorhini]
MKSARSGSRHRDAPAQWRRARAARARPGRRKGPDAPRPSGVALPPIQALGPRPRPGVKVTGLASQELRRTLRQLTGGRTGTREGMTGLSTTDLGSALDTFLDTCTLSTDGDTLRAALGQQNASPFTLPERDTHHAGDSVGRRGELVVSEIPWYYPPLKAALLRQRCCYPDDNVIFPRPTLGQFSTFSNCSDATVSSHSSRTTTEGEREGKERGADAGAAAQAKRKPISRVALKKKKKGFPKDLRGSGVSLSTHANQVTAAEAAEQLRRRWMRERRFLNRINQWCDKVMLVEESVKLAHDPVEQHERCMMVVRKEEEVLLLEMQLERHQAIQERERRRQTRQRETLEAGSLRSTLKGATRPNNWRQLLSTWTVATEDGAQKGTGAVSGEVEERRVVPLPRMITMRGAGTAPTSGVPARRPGWAPASSEGAPKCRSPSHDAGCSPLEGLRRLVDVIAMHSAGTQARDAPRPRASPTSPLYTPIPSREGALFPPPGSVYARINWVELVIDADDLPGIKRLTQRLGDCVGAADTPASASSLTLETAKVTDCSRLGGAKGPACAPFLLPLQLVYSVHGALERVVLADAVSLVPSRCLTRQRGGTHSPDNCGKTLFHPCENPLGAAGRSAEGGAEVFDLHERLLSGGAFVGDPPRPYESLVGYVVDAGAIARQSKWRSLTLKRLANEENGEVRRRILAKVMVTLPTRTVVSGQDEAGDTEKPDAPPLDGTRDDVYLLTTMSADAMDVNPFLRTVRCLSLPSPSTMQDEEPVLVAPLRRTYYAVDTRHMYFIAATALKETNERLLPALQKLRAEYRALTRALMQSESPQCDSARSRPFAFSPAQSTRATEQVCDALKLLRLEAEYSGLLATLHRNECAIIHYNLHVEPYGEFLKKSKTLWGPLYLRTLRLAYAFCVLVLGLGGLPIPPRYHPFLGPVLQLVGCHGGQKELRFRIEEYLLELEERAKRVLMPLLLRKVSAERLAELDAAAEAVASGRCLATQIMTSLAVPEDVLETRPKPVELPLASFTDTPSVAG